MDANGFDRMARGWANGATRRGVIGTLAAVGIGLAARPDGEVAAKPCKKAQQTCHRNGQCCGKRVCRVVPGTCLDGKRCCGKLGATCADACDCCGLLVCYEGLCALD